MIIATSQLCHDVWLVDLLREGELLLRLGQLDLDWRKVLIVFAVLLITAAILLLDFESSSEALEARKRLVCGHHVRLTRAFAFQPFHAKLPALIASKHPYLSIL